MKQTLKSLVLAASYVQRGMDAQASKHLLAAAANSQELKALAATVLAPPKRVSAGKVKASAAWPFQTSVKASADDSMDESFVEAEVEDELDLDAGVEDELDLMGLDDDGMDEAVLAEAAESDEDDSEEDEDSDEEDDEKKEKSEASVTARLQRAMSNARASAIVTAARKKKKPAAKRK